MLLLTDFSVLFVFNDCTCLCVIVSIVFKIKYLTDIFFVHSYTSPSGEVCLVKFREVVDAGRQLDLGLAR